MAVELEQLMQALDFPFRIQSGSWAMADTNSRICRNQIIDSAMTNSRERVMRPDYGMDAQSFLFVGTDALRRHDVETHAQQLLAQMCPRSVIEKVTIFTEGLNSPLVRLDIIFRPTEFAEPEKLELNIVQGDILVEGEPRA
jgi:phage baseplate assembly protein W